MRERVLALTAVALMALFGSASANAAPPDESVQAGEIEIEEVKEEHRDPRQQGEDQVQAWLVEMMRYASNGGVGDVSALSDDGAAYLPILYLYCLEKFGPCPHILDTTLESDVRDSRIKGEAACPMMSKFWKTWLASDLEGRSRYLLSVAHGTAVANFNARERSKYLQCKPTVKAIIAGPQASKSRYGAEGLVTAAVAKTTKLLDEIRTKHIDIHASVGLSK